MLGTGGIGIAADDSAENDEAAGLAHPPSAIAASHGRVDVLGLSVCFLEC